jgi:hypothetical protein
MKKIFRILTILTMLFFVGCGAKSSSANYPEPVVYSATPSMIPVENAPMPVRRIITKRANIIVEVDRLDDAKKGLETIIEKSGGHIVHDSLYEDRYNASLKVPSIKLQAILDKISNLGDKISQSISQDDVTNQFVDNEARLKNLILFRDKMKNLLNQTTNIEEILKIERELRRVQTEIDSIKGRLKYLKDAIALSPIEVTFEEKTIYGPLGYIFNGIWWVTKKLFVIK